MNYRQQAISDVAKAAVIGTELVAFAIEQRERVLQLETEIQAAREEIARLKEIIIVGNHRG